jgi:hypothetical protein
MEKPRKVLTPKVRSASLSTEGSLSLPSSGPIKQQDVIVDLVAAREPL